MRRRRPLDVLVNNAGIFIDHDRAPSEESVENITAVYETNVFGPIRTTQAFMPLLRAAPAARIVMTSNSAGSNTIMSDPDHPFHAIKAVAGTPMKINAGDPGHTATDFTAMPARAASSRRR